LIEVKQKNIYNKKNNGHEGFVIQCSNRQKQTLVKVNKIFIRVQRNIEKLIKFKQLLEKPSSKYRSERAIATEVVTRAVNSLKLRTQYSLAELIRNQQSELFLLLTSNKDGKQAKFNFEMDFDHNGNVITDPSFEDYTVHMMNLYDSCNKIILQSGIEFEDRLSQDYIKRRSFNKEQKDSLERFISSNIKKVNDYLYQFKHFSTIHELMNNTESNFHTTKKCQYERLKQMLTKIENFYKNIDQVPNYCVSIENIMLNTPSFKQSLSNMSTTVMNNINETMIKFLKTESSSLYTELMKYIQIFSIETKELTQYIEQSNAFRKLKNDFQTLERKVDNLESVASLFDIATLSQVYVDTAIKTKGSSNEPYPNKSVLVTESITEVRRCIELLPELFVKVRNDLEKGRDNLATKVLDTSQVLSGMIDKFEAAYVDNFHRRASTKKPKEILASVQSKTKALEDITMKTELFKESLEFLKSEGDKKVIEAYPDLNDFECHHKAIKIRQIHDITLKTWQYISIWQDKVSKIHDGNLKIIDSILKMI
jgi:hypothetical protein